MSSSVCTGSREIVPADCQWFSPRERSPRLRADRDAVDVPLIISTRNLEPVYGMETLIRAIPMVLKRLPEARIVIAGRGSQEMALKNLVDSLGVARSTRFVGSIPADRMAGFLASSDIYVSTALSDGGLAASTAEAMACELPVIVTDSAENRFWIKDYVQFFDNQPALGGVRPEICSFTIQQSTRFIKEPRQGLLERG